MASSSWAIDTCDNYDVFLSFRGEDTRYNFTSHLHRSLVDNNIKAFIDGDIRRGQEITVAIERVIEGAKMSIIVFSKRYADSTFCLDELLKIMECRESKGQIVVPIFYKVEPSEKIYEEAFEIHDQEMKVERWKSAFRKALELAGEPIDDKSNEAERIEKITTEVLLTLKEMNNSLSKGEERACTSLVGETSENNFKKIWECLMNDKISRVGVYGMGGVGKTTIATRINNQLLQVANSFTHIYWVTVSNDQSIYNLQSGIAKKMKLDLSEEDDEKRRAAMIQKELSNRKFLLILDDVWEAYELKEDVGLPPLVSGQKILLTSRNRQVCERMECLPIEVKPLSKHEAIDLFVKESNYPINDSRERRDIMHCIVEECAGLPLAIVVVARRMRRVAEIWQWRDTLQVLRKPCEGENPEVEKKVFKVLKFSYDRLSTNRCQQCFLYCSLFPEDQEFKREDLVEYWIGHGLIDEQDSMQAELDKGNVILDELVDSSLIEKIDGQQVKMHDVIRDMARIIAKVGLQLEDPFESVLVPKMLKSFSYSAPYYSKLKTLILQDDYKRKLSSSFFDNMQRLNVFHMTGMKRVKSIPDSINKLENLRVLIIHNCHYLRCIPSLAGLEKLQHLKISRNSKLKEISDGIDRLVSLRVIDLSLNKSLRRSFPIGVIKKLSHLQTLNLRLSRVEVEPKALISLKKLEILKVHFFNLQKLNSYVKSGHWRRLLDYQIEYGAGEEINLRKGMCLEAIRDVEEWEGESGLFLPDNIQELRVLDWESPMFRVLRNSTFVHLQTISIYKYKSRYLFTLDLAKHLLHHVQRLFIDDCNGLEEIIAKEEEWENRSNYPTIMLPNLKILELYDLPELRSIYRERMVCHSLELIKIEECDKLERLPFITEKEGNKQTQTIKLQGSDGFAENPVSRLWWDSLEWDDPNVESMYHPIFE